MLISALVCLIIHRYRVVSAEIRAVYMTDMNQNNSSVNVFINGSTRMLGFLD